MKPESQTMAAHDANVRGMRRLARRLRPGSLWANISRALVEPAPACSLCIEIAAGSVRLAAARPSGDEYVVHTVRGVNLRSSEAGELAAALSGLLAGFSPQDTYVTLALCRGDVLVRRLEFPSADGKEIARMVPFQAGALLPLPLGEFIVRHRVLRTTPEGRSEVAIVAAPVRLIEQRLRLIRECGLTVSAIRVSAEVLDQLLGSRLAEAPGHSSTFLIDVDGDCACISVLGEGIASISRTVTLDPATPGPRVVSTVRDLEGAFGGHLDLGLVSAPVSVADVMNAALSEAGIPTRRIALSEDIGPDTQLPGEPSCLGVTAGAARPFTRSLEFIPAEPMAGHRARPGQPRPALLAGLVLYCLVAVTLLLGFRIYAGERRLTRAYAYLQATDAAGRRLAEMQSLENEFAPQLGEASALDRLGAVCSVVPPGVTLSEVIVDRDQPTVVRGKSPEANQVLDFVEALRNSPSCSTASLEFVGSRGGDPNAEVDFEIRVAH